MAEEGSLLVKIKSYFGYPSLKEFRDDWQKLSESDKEEIKAGFTTGSMT